MSNKDRRKTLPVVKVEKDLDEDKIPKRVLPILGAPHSTSSLLSKEDLNEISSKEIPKAIPHWLKLASDDIDNNYGSGNSSTATASGRVRHSVGLDVPGAVHTIRTPSK